MNTLPLITAQARDFHNDVSNRGHAPQSDEPVADLPVHPPPIHRDGNQQSHERDEQSGGRYKQCRADLDVVRLVSCGTVGVLVMTFAGIVDGHVETAEADAKQDY